MSLNRTSWLSNLPPYTPVTRAPGTVFACAPFGRIHMLAIVSLLLVSNRIFKGFVLHTFCTNPTVIMPMERRHNCWVISTHVFKVTSSSPEEWTSSQSEVKPSENAIRVPWVLRHDLVCIDVTVTFECTVIHGIIIQGCDLVILFARSFLHTDHVGIVGFFAWLGVLVAVAVLIVFGGDNFDDRKKFSTTATFSWACVAPWTNCSQSWL